MENRKRGEMMGIQLIRDYYDVPAKVGGRVKYMPCEGSPEKSYIGTITGTRGQYLLVRLDGQKKSLPYHPTWQIDYLEEGIPL